MPWHEVSVMDQRREFVRLATQAGANRRELCRRFGISPDVGYKWLRRAFAGDGCSPIIRGGRIAAPITAMPSSKRRSLRSAKHIPPGVRARSLVVSSTMGRRRRRDQPCTRSCGATVSSAPAQHEHPGPYQRFEKEMPNQLWQMDFKGEMPLGRCASCYPLTVIDDHSRYALCLGACANQQSQTVQQQLTTTFRRYGLPTRSSSITALHGAMPSGAPWTKLGVWLLKLGVDLWHSRPYHPQSRGKNERFHRTLKAEVFHMQRFSDLADLQRAFDRWRSVYNLQRPHEALDLNVPASRYRPSSRTMPDRLPDVAYDSHEIVRTCLHHQGLCQLQGAIVEGPASFLRRMPRHQAADVRRRFGIFYGSHQIAAIDLREPSTVHCGERP